MDYRNLRSLRTLHKNIFGLEEAINYDLFDVVSQFENAPNQKVLDEITNIIGCMEDCLSKAYYCIGIYGKTKNNPPVDEYFMKLAERHFEAGGKPLDFYVDITKKMWNHELDEMLGLENENSEPCQSNN